MISLWKASADVAYLHSVTDAADGGPDEVRVLATLKRSAGYWYVYAGETEIGATCLVLESGANARTLTDRVKSALIRHHQLSLELLA